MTEKFQNAFGFVIEVDLDKLHEAPAETLNAIGRAAAAGMCLDGDVGSKPKENDDETERRA